MDDGVGAQDGVGVGVQDGVGVGLRLRHWAMGLLHTSCPITGPHMDWCCEVVHMRPQELLVVGLLAACSAGAGFWLTTETSRPQ